MRRGGRGSCTGYWLLVLVLAIAVMEAEQAAVARGGWWMVAPFGAQATVRAPVVRGTVRVLVVEADLKREAPVAALTHAFRGPPIRSTFANVR